MHERKRAERSKMRDYLLQEKFALIALSGLDCRHGTQAKKAALLGIAAARLLQGLLEAEAERRPSEFSDRLEEGLKDVLKMSSRQLRALEKETADPLMEEGILTTVPSLLGCDMNYYTANVTIREYRCDETLYRKLTEELRAEILEPGEVAFESVGLLWLLRESGCIHDLFSSEEQKEVESRLQELKGKEEPCRILLEMEFHSGVRQAYLNLLKGKRELFKNPYLEGVNLLFPFFDRRQAIFIDMVIFGTGVGDRRRAAMEFIREQGHTCEELKVGSETFVKIDNCGYYRIWPATRYCKLPIQGVELLPVYR